MIRPLLPLDLCTQLSKANTDAFCAWNNKRISSQTFEFLSKILAHLLFALPSLFVHFFKQINSEEKSSLQIKRKCWIIHFLILSLPRLVNASSQIETWMLPHFSHFSTDPVPMWLSYTVHAGMNFTRKARTKNLPTPEKRWAALGSWLTSPTSRFVLVIDSSTFSLLFPLFGNVRDLCWLLIFLWCRKKSCWSWTLCALQQTKVVTKEEKSPGSLLCFQISFCGVSNKTSQTKTLSGCSAIELLDTLDFSFIYVLFIKNFLYSIMVCDKDLKSRSPTVLLFSFSSFSQPDLILCLA